MLQRIMQHQDNEMLSAQQRGVQIPGSGSNPKPDVHFGLQWSQMAKGGFNSAYK